MEDRQIIDLFFERNEDAIRETQSKYGRLCYKIAFNILNDSSECEECVSDTYISLWNKIPPERPNNFKAFICRIARNLSLKKWEYNNAQKRNSSFTVSLSELDAVIPDESFKYEIEEENLGELINAFLKNEKDIARNVFIRRYYFHDDIAEIAQRYSFSESKVKSLLFHTRNKLRKFLNDKGVCV